jgi:hypothetical protein
MSSAHVDELVDLEALGALEAPESARVRAHSTICPTCRAALRAAEETAARLALSVPLRTAPPVLRARVMRSIDDPAPLSAVPVPLPVRRPHVLRRVTNRWGALAAALVIVPVIGLLTWAIVLQTQVNELKQESKQIQEAQRDIVLFSPPSFRAKLEATEPDAGATGWVTWIPDEGRCAVKVKGLAKLEAGASYHVFFKGTRDAVDAGELKPNDEGKAELEFDTSRWQGFEYRVWVAPVRPGAEAGPPVLKATLRRE